MNDDELKHAYERWLATRAAAGRAVCPDGEALLALAQRQGAEDQRLATLDHVMACAACRRELELLRSVVEAGTREGLVSRAQPWWHNRPLRAAAAIALLALTGTAVVLMRQDRVVMRGEPGALVAISPRDAVPREVAQRLVWRSLPDAIRYDVELLSDEGRLLSFATTRDTFMLVSAELVEPGRAYVWTLRAARTDGTQAEAAPIRFRVRP